DVDVPLSSGVLSPPELQHEIEAHADVKLGLRPEHIRIAAPGEDGGIPGRVQFLEPVGSDLYLTVEAGGGTVQVRTDPDSPLQTGEDGSLALGDAPAPAFGTGR